MKLLIQLSAALFVTLPLATFAHEHDKSIVPGEEKEIAARMGMEGPAETKGVGEVKVLGTMPLDGEMEGLQGYVMRVREITLLPGGQVAVHQHHSRPGAAYVIEGELVEHRNDVEGPVDRGPGDVALEKSGIVHWWENKSAQAARVVVVDIIKPE